MSPPRPSFRATASRRLAEDGGDLPPAVEEFLSDTRRMAVRLLPTHLITLHPSRSDVPADPAALSSLVASVRQLGVLEPVLVRPIEFGRFELVAGERRLRAARIAEIEAIPAVVREMDDETAAVLVAARAADAAVEPARVGDVASTPGAHSVRHQEPYRIADLPRPRRETNGTYMPPAVVTRREPIVISGPGIPGPRGVLAANFEPAEQPASVGDGTDRRPRFRFAPFPFLRRSRNDPREHR